MQISLLLCNLIAIIPFDATLQQLPQPFWLWRLLSARHVT